MIIPIVTRKMNGPKSAKRAIGGRLSILTTTAPFSSFYDEFYAPP